MSRARNDGGMGGGDPKAMKAEKAYAEAVQALQDGKPAKAESLCKKVLKIVPGNHDVLHLLGIACLDQGRAEDAIRHLKKSISINAFFADTYNNLGTALLATKAFEEAEEAFKKAIELDPKSVLAHDNLGIAYLESGKQTLAIDSFRKVLELDPDHSRALSDIAMTSRHICDWSSHDKLRQSMVHRVRKDSPGVNPFTLMSYSDSAEDLEKCARRFAQDNIAKAVPVSSRASRDDDRIRVAYVSAGFQDAPIAYRILPILKGHDRSRFEVIGISVGADDRSTMRQEMADACDQFHDFRTRSDRDIAQFIADRKVHIAVDLTGYTFDMRPNILAFRPAPIQAQFLGYPGTLGTDHIDYVIVDQFVVPENQEQNFSEEFVRLPDCMFVKEPLKDTLDKAKVRGDAGLPEDGMVLCAINGIYEVIPEMFDVWMRLMVEVPDSVLLMMSDNKFTRANLQNEAQARGVEADRLVIVPAAGPVERSRLIGASDIFLDTLPQNSWCDAHDALLRGVPVVSAAGRSFAGRMTMSMLKSLGLDRMVAPTVQDYERIAIGLASDANQLERQREMLAKALDYSSLGNPTPYLRDLENAYRVMVKSWAEDRPISPIALTSLSA